MPWALTMFGPEGALIVMNDLPLTRMNPGVAVDGDVLTDDRPVVVDPEGDRGRAAVGDEGLHLAVGEEERVPVAVGAHHGAGGVDPEGHGGRRSVDVQTWPSWT